MDRFYDLNKIAKFFVICAAAFVFGLVLFVIGLAAGGVDGFHKVSEEHDWINVDPSDVHMVDTKCEFNAVEVTGDMDVVLVGKDGYDSVIKEYNLTEIENLGSGTVVFRYGERLGEPEITVDSGVLKMNNLPGNAQAGVNLDFSERVSEWPVAIVFCNDKELESVKVDSDYADVEMIGVAFKKADIRLDSGDVDMANIKSKGLKINSSYCDVEISGDLQGKTEITVDSGDVEVDTLRDYGEYTIQVETSSGDVKIGKKKFDLEGHEYVQGGGENTLTIKLEYGDIEIGNMAPPDTVEL